MRTGADHFKEEPARGFSPSEIPDYTTYPREFITYKWYRPLLVLLLLAIFFFISDLLIIFCTAFATGDLNHILDLATGGYDTLDAYTPVGVIVTLGSVAVMIPCLALANKIAGKRPFSSYTSSRVPRATIVCTAWTCGNTANPPPSRAICGITPSSA